MYCAIMLKLLSGAALKAAICAGVVFLSATNIALAVASVDIRAALLAPLASLTSLLYAPRAKAANSMTTVTTTTSSVIVKPPWGRYGGAPSPNSFGFRPPAAEPAGCFSRRFEPNWRERSAAICVIRAERTRWPPDVNTGQSAAAHEVALKLG